MGGTQLVEALTDMDIPSTQSDMKDRGEKVAKLFWSQSFRSRSRMILTTSQKNHGYWLFIKQFVLFAGIFSK